VRTKVRAARKRGLLAQWHGPEALDDFYAVYRDTMRRLGSPVHARRFFAIAAAAVGARLLIVRDTAEEAQGRAVAAAFVVSDERWIGFPFAASLTAARAKHPNLLLYWTLIETACREGYAALDLGRSPRGSGPAHFKAQWGAEEEPLAYAIRPTRPGAGGPDDAASPRLHAAAAVWRRLPERLTDAAGPHLARRLP
jgi:lipid II:glycine glycyltransferase (peptidoglycan interpeptide bridge formation enzyme)